jgi:hypothetical protein
VYDAMLLIRSYRPLSSLVVIARQYRVLVRDHPEVAVGALRNQVGHQIFAACGAVSGARRPPALLRVVGVAR